MTISPVEAAAVTKAALNSSDAQSRPATYLLPGFGSI